MNEVQAPLTEAETQEALKIARELVDAGIPIFSAAPDSSRPGEYLLPKAWQDTKATKPDGTPNYGGIDRWRQGWCLGMVGGHAADALDNDPRNGGHESMRELEIQGQVPRYFGKAVTPSGGEHYLIGPTGERKSTGFMPGLDLQSGSDRPDAGGGHGRGFVFISPTIRPSKAAETIGQLRPYRWVDRPDTEQLAEFSGGDDSLEGLIARVHAARSRSSKSAAERTSAWAEAADASESQLFGGGGWKDERAYTLTQAKEFCRPALEELAAAEIGDIENRCNNAAAQLSHFVPSHLSVDAAMEILRGQLASTAYDEAHPNSRWTVEKFRPVLDGSRPPLDNWKALLAAEPAAQLAPGEMPPAAMDDVEALLGELLTAEQMADRPRPRPLVKGYLNMDSEAWLIGAAGSKKSFIALDIAGHVALGLPWQGRQVTQGKVLIIAAEGAAGYASRIQAWEKRYGKLGDQLLVLPRPVQSSDRARWSVLVEAARRVEPVLIVLDTQARVTVGLEENSAKDMGLFIAAVGAIRAATGGCVLSIHHTGRSGGDARGSSALDGAQDTELKISVGQEHLHGELRVEKQKDLEPAQPLALRFERVVVGVDEDGEDITTLVLLQADAWRDAEGEVTAVDVGQVQTISEPAPWIVAACRPDAVVQHRILQVLLDVAGLAGLTEAKVLALVAERWHSGQVGRGAGKLNRQVFQKSWQTVVDRDEVIPGEYGSASWALDPEWVRDRQG